MARLYSLPASAALLCFLAAGNLSTQAAPSISATKTDTIVPNSAGRASQGGSIRYTTVITNGGPDPATGVQFSDPTPTNTTLVAGSANVSPLARNDNYTVAGNTVLRVGGTAGSGPEVYVSGSVLDNDSEFLGDTFTLTPITNGGSANGGTVNLAADGSFTYLPPTGFTGNDTFTYTLRDDGTDNIAGNGDDLTGSGIVTLTVSSRVWYVDSTAAAGGSGRANAPFNTLSAAQTASAANDYIYVYERSGDYNGNLTLKNGQRLIGSGVALVVGSNTLLAAGSNTTWANTGGDAITLAQNNAIQGFTIGDTAGTDIIGASVGTLNISKVTLTGGGRAFAITTGGTLGVVFDSLSSTSGTNAVSLTGCDGNLTISGGTVNGPTGDDVVLNGGSLSVSFQATITNSVGRSVNIINKTGGTVAFSGQITDTGTGILCDNNDQSGGTATIVFTGGLNISTGGNAAFTATNGGNIRVIQNNISVVNTLTTTTATALNISDTLIDAMGVTFRNITSNGGTAAGIILSNTGSSGGLTVTGLDGADVGTAPDSGSGGALVNKSSGTDGDPLTGTGIYLNLTSAVSLSGMSIANCQNHGIRGLSVTGFTLAHTGFGGTLGTTTAGHEGAIAFGTANPGGANGLIGIGLMDNVDVFGAVEHQVEFYSQSSIANLTISNCNIHDNNPTTGGSGIQMEMAGTANTTLAINNSTFTNNRTRAVQFTTLQSSVANVTINGNTLLRSTQGLDGIFLQNAGDADLTTTVSNNSISGLGGSAIFVGQVANNANAASELRATISGNTVTTPAAATDHAILALLSSAPGQVSQARLLIDNNTVNQNATAGNLHGILVDVRDSGSSPNFHATVTSNKVEVNDQTAGLAGIAIQSRQAATGHTDIRDNDVDFDNGTPAGAFGLRVLQADTATLEVQRGALAMGSAIAATLTGNNSASTNEVFGTVTVSDNNVVLLPGAPLMFAPEAERPVLKAAALPEQNVPAASAAETAVAPTLPDEVETPVQEALTQAQLDVQVEAALSRWEAAGLSDSQMALLKGLRFELTDLPGMHLGHASGSTIKISTHAAGQGWFVDATPADDAEFSRQAAITRHTVRAGDTAAAGLVDLLTALMHEMGHALGLADRYDLKDRDSVMFGYLAQGERRLPARGEAASVAPFQDETQRFLSALITLGTLPPGKSLTIVYDVTIGTTTDTSISSQALVIGSNFVNVASNDPDTIAANDATVTQVEQLPTVSNISVSVNEDGILTFAATQFDAGFSDVNALPAQDTLQAIQITSLPANGTLTKEVTNDAVAVNDIITRAGIANLKFTPASNFSGSTSFGWKGSDGQAFSVAGALVGITVNEVNDEPTLNVISDPAAILEGAPQQTVNLSGIGAGTGETQTLTVTAVSNNTALIPNPTVTYTSPDATGQLRYTPVANAFGTAVITVTVQDNGGTLNGGDDTFTRTFTVAVTNVNDAPTLNALMNPSPILPTAGQQTVNLSGISEGPNESAQTLNVTALSSNPGVIPHPTVNYVEGSSTGTLTYTPTGAVGNASITVSVQDNGGTLNGGVDLTTRTFSVNVTNFVAVSTVNPGDDTATEGGDTGVFTFTRGATTGVLVASFQLDPGSTASAADHALTGAGIAYNSAAGTGTVTFPDGVASVTATLTAAAEAVQFAEANETVTLNVVNQPGTYIAGTPATATVTIAQNGFIVINTNDADEGSLRQAVWNANELSGANTITFAGPVFEDASADTITITSNEISITSEVVIQGPGAKMLAVSGNQELRIFRVNVAAPVHINDLSLTRGLRIFADGGGALYNDGADLTLTNCRVVSNTAMGAGAGLASVSGSLTLIGTTVSENVSGTVLGSGGGGIHIDNSKLVLINSTVTGNVALSNDLGGGGIWISSASPMVSIINSTITNNRAGGDNSASGVYVAPGGVVPLVYNSIIAGNTDNTVRPDVRGSFDAGSSHNIIGTGASSAEFTSANGNIIGTTASPVNPLLAGLADNGGPTATHALTNGSPALNAGGVISERQQVTVTGGAGTFTLTFNGQTTMTLTYNTSAAGMQVALESLSNIGFGRVVVSQASNVYTVSFQGTLAGVDQPQLTAAPAGGAAVNIVTQMDGGTPAYDQRGVGFPRQVGGVQDMGAYEAQQILTVASASQSEGNAGGPLMNFTLTRSGPTTDATFVDFSVVASGTHPASAADFVGGVWPVGSVTIPAGSASVPLTIPVLGDSTVEYDETFSVILSNAFAPYLIASTSITGTITNDDTATASIEKISNGAEITVPIDGLFRVTLSARSSTDTTLAYSVGGTASEEVDYSTLSRSVTIPAGQTAADIVVDVLNDGDTNESLETVVVTLTSVSSGNPAISLGSPVSATVDIISTAVPLHSPLGDVVTDNGAPGTDGTTSIGDFGILRRGAFLAENSDVVFPGSLIVGSGSTPVTLDDSQGIWKGSGGSLYLIARTGTTVPDIAGTVFDYLPIVPAITDAGEVTLLASLRIGVGGVTADNDTGIWSEVGGGGLSLVIREGEPVPGLLGIQVGRLATGAYATATTGATTGETAFSVTFKGNSTDTAILRASVSGAAVSVQVVARENSPAPGTALQFGNIAGSYSDPARMDATGNLVFAALTKPGNLDGIWYQPLGGSLAKVVIAGETAPGTSGATFSKIQRPSMGSNGRIAFRGLLNANGDNSAGLRNDGIWFGDAANPASFTCILRRGDTNATVAGLTATQKVGNVWGGWLSNGNRGAWKGWVDMDGNGTSAAPTDVHGIYANTSGSMELILKVGDAAPGVSGATFTGFDLPLVGGQEQAAFLGVIAGPGITQANNQGVWREGANGGGLTLLLRTGDTISTTMGSKTVQAIDFPSSGQTDRRWEQPVMDSNGRILMNVIFTDGSSSQLMSP